MKIAASWVVAMLASRNRGRIPAGTDCIRVHLHCHDPAARSQFTKLGWFTPLKTSRGQALADVILDHFDGGQQTIGNERR